MIVAMLDPCWHKQNFPSISAFESSGISIFVGKNGRESLRAAGTSSRIEEKTHDISTLIL